MVCQSVGAAKPRPVLLRDDGDGTAARDVWRQQDTVGRLGAPDARMAGAEPALLGACAEDWGRKAGAKPALLVADMLAGAIAQDVQVRSGGDESPPPR